MDGIGTIDAQVARAAWTALGGDPAGIDRLAFAGPGALPSAFAVSELAAGTVGAAVLAIAAWAGDTRAVRVDRRLASFWFQETIQPIGWQMPSPWDPIAGDYRTTDGWIRLHTNAPHHRAAALAVLGAPAEKPAVAERVGTWRADDLEAAVIAQGGCAATMRDLAAWRAHPHGQAVAAEPLIRLDPGSAAPSTVQAGLHDAERPLADIRVLDLTRVLAGPVATRFLAGFGADVLRIDPPDWQEPGVVPSVTLGKRCAHLDLRRAEDLRILRDLLARADILVHGYRPDALARLGLDAAERQRLRPGLVDVCLDAYGWTGPWAGRRGFDSLVQMSSGIAAEGMRHYATEAPRPLPVQALDHATGYLMATAAVMGLIRRRATGRGMIARASLARTAHLLTSLPPAPDSGPFAPMADADFTPEPEATSWGPARRLRPPVAIDGIPMRWDRGASALGSADPVWLPRPGDEPRP